MGRIIKQGDPTYAPKPVTAQAIRIASNLTAAQAKYNQIRNDAKDQVIELAVAMAARVVGKAVELEPGLLDSIYKKTMDATAKPEKTTAILHVHPLDKNSSNVEQTAAAAGFTIVEDPHVGQNGCMVQVGHTQIDATLDTIMETLKNALKAT